MNNGQTLLANDQTLEQPRAISILQHARGSIRSGDDVQELVRNAKGLVFLSSFKASLGVGFTHGAGFVIARFGERRKWSGPSFLTWNDASVGLSVGGGQIDTLVILLTDEAVDLYKKGTFRTDQSMTISIVFVKDSADELGNVLSNEDAVSFSFMKGVIWDTSLNIGLVSPDTATNAEFYGKECTPAEILNGEVEGPKDRLMPLYQGLCGFLRDPMNPNKVS